MKTNIIRIKAVLVLAAALFISAVPVRAQEGAPVIYPTAIFPMAERGAEVRGYGDKAADILFAALAAHPEIMLVERAELNKILQELEISLTGIVNPGQAARVGQLTGAKILITGSVFEVSNRLYIVARVIGTETSRVLGRSVTGRMDDFGMLAEDLGKQVGEVIIEEGGKLVPEEKKQEDLVAVLNKALGQAERPTVFVRIEERHIGQPAIDPAAETELMLLLKKTGFEVVDRRAGITGDVDILIEGEGFSEFAMRKGNLVSVKARLEVKAVDLKTDKVIAVDRQTSVAVDLTEQIAGKKALQDASASIAGRLIPRLVSQ